MPFTRKIDDGSESDDTEGNVMRGSSTTAPKVTTPRATLRGMVALTTAPRATTPKATAFGSGPSATAPRATTPKATSPSRVASTTAPRATTLKATGGNFPELNRRQCDDVGQPDRLPDSRTDPGLRTRRMPPLRDSFVSPGIPHRARRQPRAPGDLRRTQPTPTRRGDHRPRADRRNVHPRHPAGRHGSRRPPQPGVLDQLAVAGGTPTAVVRPPRRAVFRSTHRLALSRRIGNDRGR